jgi:nucleoid-associated protein YgaU
MTLSKASITPEGGSAKIEVLFNPAQYSLDKGNQIAEIGVPGLGAPILQFVRGNTRTLTMELFFDTYEEQKDVRVHTDRMYALLGIDADTHVPPVCMFAWGTFTFRCVLERVGGRFTLFLADGTPVRATLNVTFKEWQDLEVEVRANPTRSADHRTAWTVRRGDTLAAIAAAEYGDAAKWRVIADANGIDNPRRVAPGQVLIIPPLRGPVGGGAR